MATQLRIQLKLIPAFKLSLFFFLLSIIPCMSYADKLSIYISGGSAFTKLKNDNSVTLNDFVVNNYNTDVKTNWNGLWGVGIAHTYNHMFNLPINFSLGMAGYTYNFGNVKGTEYPFVNDGVYDTLNYKFRAKTQALMLESRLFYDNKKSWQPFLLLGIGSAWNDLSSYTETPTDPSLSAAPVPAGFANNTQQALAYELGIGILLHLYENSASKISYSSSLDYRYFNFGKGQLGSFPAMTTNNRLTVNMLNANAVMFTLTASFV